MLAFLVKLNQVKLMLVLLVLFQVLQLLSNS
jgi:hypothetical protein